MKIRTTYLATILLLSPTAAFAQSVPLTRPHISVGVDYDYLSVSYQNVLGVNASVALADTINGADPHVGLRYGRLGAELGYLWTADSTKSIGTGSTKVSVSGPTLDLLGFIPTPLPGFEGIVTAGVSDFDAKASGFGVSTSSREIGYRGGLGVQYAANSNSNVRATIRYQSADFDHTLDHAIIASVGLNYQF